MYERLLVPMDGTSVAAEGLMAALRLATRWHAHIDIVTLLRRGDRMLQVDEVVEQQVSRIRQLEASSAGGSTTAVHISYSIRDMEYSVVDDIARQADEVENTLVVMGSQARDRGAAVVPNVAEDLLRHLRRPVLFVGPKVAITGHWPEGGTLAVCTDGSEFANAILPLAASWTQQLELPQTVLTVINPDDLPKNLNVAAEANAAARIAGDLESLSGTPADYEVLHGEEPAVAVVDYCDRYDVSLLALTTHSRTGLSRLLDGSEAMRIVHRAPCPVLIHRP